MHFHSDFIDFLLSSSSKKEPVLRMSNRYNIFSEYSVPARISDEPIMATAHTSAFVIKMVVDFPDFISCLLVQFTQYGVVAWQVL